MRVIRDRLIYRHTTTGLATVLHHLRSINGTIYIILIQRNGAMRGYRRRKDLLILPQKFTELIYLEMNLWLRR